MIFVMLFYKLDKEYPQIMKELLERESKKGRKVKSICWTKLSSGAEMCWRTAFVYKIRKNSIVTQKNANKREKSVDFVSKKVYSIQALNERASQTSQRNEKSTDRKKKVLDRMTRLWYSN